LVTVGGALASFSAALALSVSSAPSPSAAADDDDASATIGVHQPSKDLGIATRRDLLPGAAPLPKAQAHPNDDLDALGAALTAAANAGGVPKKLTRKPVALPSVAKRSARDLKDPFKNQ
jgi:hypothetical protein